MYSEDGTTYGIAIASAVGGTTTSCSKGTSRCIGSSVPGNNLEPYFTITCGASTYLGPDKYHFSPAQSTTGTYDQWTPIRSYICDGMASTVRPTWKLMGYFPPLNAGCQALQNSTYSETFCTVSLQIALHINFLNKVLLIIFFVRGHHHQRHLHPLLLLPQHQSLTIPISSNPKFLEGSAWNLRN